METWKRLSTPLLGVLLILGAFFFYSTVSSKAAAEEKIPEQVVLPQYIRPQIKGWAYTEGLTLESSCEVALVPGGDKSSLELYVDAPTDENGQIHLRRWPDLDTGSAQTRLFLSFDGKAIYSARQCFLQRLLFP